jgi:hypothetical protein
LTIPKGAAENAETIRAVVETDDGNINRQLIDKGYGRFRKDLGGAEQQAMFGRLARTLGKYAEEVSFEGDNSAINPMRYIPTPFHTKMWQERTAYSQYLQQEAIGTRMRRWERPIHDFLAPYFRGLIERTTDTPVISAEVEHRRDLDTLTDMLAYLRSLKMAAEDPEHQVPPRSQHICLAHACEIHPAAHTLQSSSVDFTLRRPGNTSFSACDWHLRIPPHRSSWPPRPLSCGSLPARNIYI